MQNLPALITLVAYSIALIGISLWVSRKAGTEAEFILGERDLGPWVAGLAYAASSSSAWVLLGFSGFVYAIGISALWMVPGILVGSAAIWFFAGPMLQASSRISNHLTLTDFLAEGTGPRTARWIRRSASLMIVFCFSFFVASQFQGAGIAFDGIFHSGLLGGVLIGAAVILAYTFFGGFLAVSLIDTIQGALMGLVAILLPVAAFFHAGGIEGIRTSMEHFPEGHFQIFGTRTGWMAAGFVLGLSSTGIGALGQPHLASWIMATRDRASLTRGAIVAIAWATIVYAGMAVLGLSARAIFGPDLAPESVFFEVAGSTLPTIFSGIILAATLSAIMSTVDSQLLVAGAAISHDLGLSRFLGDRKVLASRLSVSLIAAAAVFCTFNLPSTIFDRALFAWTALGASFGPIVAMRALGLKPAGAAILTAMLAAFAMSLAYEFVLPAGPGSVWARTIPWLASLVILAAGTRKPRTVSSPAGG